ncbi:MAG: prepilin-type N-terminal cleavage/methylation domain-containing protein [Planctomycetota bacterium]|nr:prepilin-type N-terminal cleavage/methylation domain-containing protein [Planctomycetota bacterium]
MKPTPSTTPRAGFTLIEAMVATAIVGMGVSAMMMASQSGTRVTADSQERARAVFLAQEVREWIASLPFKDPDVGQQNNPPGPDGSSPQVFVDDVDDMKDVTYSPPRDAQGTAVAAMTGWSQKIKMTWVSPTNFSASLADGASNVIKIRVDILHNAKTVLTSTWIVTKGSAQ